MLFFLSFLIIFCYFFLIFFFCLFVLPVFFIFFILLVLFFLCVSCLIIIGDFGFYFIYLFCFLFESFFFLFLCFAFYLRVLFLWIFLENNLREGMRLTDLGIIKVRSRLISGYLNRYDENWWFQCDFLPNKHQLDFNVGKDNSNSRKIFPILVGNFKDISAIFCFHYNTVKIIEIHLLC